MKSGELSKYISLSCYCTSFVMKLVNKFKMSFGNQRPSFENCPPPYTAIHFIKSWVQDTKAKCKSASFILGPALKTDDAKDELFRYCRDIPTGNGYHFNHVSIISGELPAGYEVGDTKWIEGIITPTDIHHIVGKYYELLAKESKG